MNYRQRKKAHQGELMRFHMAERVLKKNYPDMRIPVKALKKNQRIWISNPFPIRTNIYWDDLCGRCIRFLGENVQKEIKPEYSLK